MADMDERIEKVIASVIPEPELRHQVKEMIKRGDMLAEWDEETDSPRFITTAKLAETIRRKNMPGQGPDHDTRWQEGDPEPDEDRDVFPDLINALTGDEATIQELVDRAGAVEMPTELFMEVHAHLHGVATAYMEVIDIVKEVMGSIDDDGNITWHVGLKERAMLVRAMANDLTIELNSQEIANKVAALLDSMTEEGGE